MLVLISPAKKLDFESLPQTDEYSLPDFLPQSQELIEVLKKYSVAEISKLMKLSDKLSQLNHDRYQQWHLPFTPQNAKQAVLTFKGDVYAGMNIESFDAQQLAFTQDHLRILSGLYGLLRPLDLMQPYRLEMGTKLKTSKGNNLYQYWGSTITDAINRLLEEKKYSYVINLASNEYFSAVQTDKLRTPVLTPVFKEYRGDRDGQPQYKIISLLAKRARGMMSAYILKNRLDNIEDIKSFNEAGYQFNEALSKDLQWVFTRDQQPGK